MIQTHYTGVQSSLDFAPGAGLVGVRNPITGKYVELTFYQYGGTVRHNGQIFELFLNDDPTGIADLSVRGIIEHHGSRINARNGKDTISASIGAITGRAGLWLHGTPEDMPQDMRIGHGRSDGVFSFVTGIGGVLEGGTEVARIGEEGLTLKQRSEAPGPGEGCTVLWAKDDGTLQVTSNVCGATETLPLGVVR